MDYQLSLTEYSAKYKVSVSTLRRRIKKDEVAFIKNDGKYLLPDIAYDNLLNASSQNIAPPQRKLSINEVDSGEIIVPPLKDDNESEFLSKALDNVDDYPIEKEVKTNNLTEIKRAYSLILNEKEEQILQLRQHIVDLQTLNRTLENEIDRLENEQVFNSSKTSFLKHEF